MVFVDFSKTFDTVGRIWLWQLLRKYGCPEKFTTMIEALHTGMMNVCVGGEVSESFSVTNLSYLQCSTRLSETWGMASIYKLDRALTYSTSHTSEQKPTLLGYWWESCYSQITLVAHSAEEMQKIVDVFSDASNKINIKKTEVLYQPNSTRTR